MKRAALALLLVALVLPLAACGGDVSPDLSGVAQAAEKTESARTARFELAFGAGEMSFSARGAVDYDRNRTRMAMDLSSLGEALGQGAPASAVDAVLDGSDLYVRFPSLTGFVRPARPWLKLDLEKLAARSGVDLSELDQLSHADPAQALAYLQGAGGFDEVGTEDVRGVETTHYEGTIDPEEGAAKLSAHQREEVERLLEGSSVSALPAEAWIDRDGYLRRLTVTLPDHVTTSMELFDFGQDVDIDVPSDDEVTVLTELAGKGIDQG